MRAEWSLRRMAWLLGSLSALLVCASGCKQSTGTFVHLNFKGTVDSSLPITQIQVALAMAGRSDSTVFSPSSGQSVITLPTDGTLEIQSGEGALTVEAYALAGDGRRVGVGSGSGTVVSGQTTLVTVLFAAPVTDAGTSGADLGGVDIGSPSSKDAGAGEGVDAGADQGFSTGGADARASGGTDGADAPKDTGADVPVTINPDTAGVDGTAATYKLAITPSVQNFGGWAVGTVATAVFFTISNQGVATTPALTIFVGDGTRFPVYQDRCSGAKLAQDGTCTISFTFIPDAAGTVQTNGSVGVPGGSSVAFLMSGTGTSGSAAALSLSPNTVDFENVDVGTSSAVTFTVTNNGTSDSGLVQVQVSGSSAFMITGNHCATVTLGELGQCTFNLTFAPTVFGSAAGTVTVQATSAGSTTSAAKGTGRDYVQLKLQFAGTGGGTLTASGTSCASTSPCSIGVARTDTSAIPQITITEQPDGTSLFGGFSGDCTGTGTCMVSMDTTRAVTATFNPISPARVALNVIGYQGQTGSIVSGDGLLSCSGSCPSLSHATTSSLTLTAQPGSGSSFIGWSDGPCRGTTAKCTFALTGDVAVTATFGPQSYVFVSSSTVVPGSLNGVGGADKECQRLASNANLPGTYQAWISTTGVAAKTRVGSGGWVRTDGRAFAANLSALAVSSGQSTYYPPRLDEMGNDLGNTAILVATGTTQDGSSFGTQCGDYASTTGSLYVGNAAAGVYSWSMTQLDSAGCANAYHLYCFRTDARAGTLAPPSMSGRHIFVSKSAFTPGGALGPDASCQKEASAANLANASTFVAFLSTSTAPALTRITSSGLPWIRSDNVVVAPQASDFGTGKLLATPNLSADGTSYLTSYVWGGAGDPSSVSATTCSDWSSGSASVQGMVGFGNTSAAPDWFSFNKASIACNDSNTHLVCIEP